MTPRLAIAIYTASVERARADYLSRCSECRHYAPVPAGDTCRHCRYGERP